MRQIPTRRTVVTAVLVAVGFALAIYAFTPREAVFNTQQLLTTAEQECRSLGGGWTYRRAGLTDGTGTSSVVELAVSTTGPDGEPLSDHELRERHALRVANGWTDQDLDVLRTEVITTDGSGQLDDGVNDIIGLPMSEHERLRRLTELRTLLNTMPHC